MLSGEKNKKQRDTKRRTVVSWVLLVRERGYLQKGA